MEAIHPPRQITAPKWLILTICSALLSTISATFSLIAFVDYEHKLAEFRDSGGYILGVAAQASERVIATVKPAVVSILTTTSAGKEQPEQSVTGMIISQDGIIITSNSATTSAAKLTIITDAGDIYDDPTVLLRDTATNIAVLKLAGASYLPTVTLGDSTFLEVGTPVWAIGSSAGGHQNAVTEGNISAVHRHGVLTTPAGTTIQLHDMVQTDAAISSYTAGGPLVNPSGEVIAMNTGTFADAQGLSLSLPINTVKEKLRSLRR